MSKIVEEWRPVVGYEGLYEVSDWGRIKSCDRVVDCLNKGKYQTHRHIKGKIMKKSLTIWGYEQVMLYKGKSTSHQSVHRLVAEAFIPNPLNLPEVNHKDENKRNNSYINLEWCDRKYNKNYGNRTDKVRKKLINRKDQSKRVYQYTLDGDLIKVWPSTAEIKRILGFSSGSISFACANSKSKQSHGYKWSYNEIN